MIAKGVAGAPQPLSNELGLHVHVLAKLFRMEGPNEPRLHRGLAKYPKKLFVHFGNREMGKTGFVIIWSTATTANPASDIARDNDPHPAKTSIKIGCTFTEESLGETGCIPSQSV